MTLLRRLRRGGRARRARERDAPGESEDPAGAPEEVVRSEVHAWKRVSFALAVLALLGVSVGFGGIAVALGVLPLKEVQPMLAVIDKRENAVFRLAPLRRTTTSWNIVTEVLICQYVTTRNEIRLDSGEMSVRWGRDGFVDLLSTNDVFKAFTRSSLEKLPTFEQNGYIRRVALLSEPVLLEKIDGTRYYRLDFRTDVWDPQSESSVHTSYHTANIAVRYGSKTVLEGPNRYLNPIGLQVVNYGEAPLANESVRDKDAEGVECGRGLV